VNSVFTEVSTRGSSSGTTGVRIMIVSSEQDDDSLAKIIEECGGVVVSDFTCPGRREFGADVETGGSPIEALARRYLGLYCARTYRHSPDGYSQDLEERFRPIGKLIREFRVEGVILRVHRCCDPYGLEVPSLRKYLLGQGVAVLYIEDDYSIRDRGRLRTRIQAFIEVGRDGPITGASGVRKP
ncbi:MAG: 2-hydroxyacyl-CoA dehydratase family protein, partial [Dehalococcoidia bacterium]|nr:2-hydroxyacyl-CoA dehydratase family protein [Dehalococcoidia bacterium]